MDWYEFLSEEFKLPRGAYRQSDRAVFRCVKCGSDQFVRVAHVREKLSRTGKAFECSGCRKSEGAGKARSIRAQKKTALRN